MEISACSFRIFLLLYPRDNIYNVIPQWKRRSRLYIILRDSTKREIMREPLSAAGIHDWRTGSTAFFHAMCTLLERARGVIPYRQSYPEY